MNGKNVQATGRIFAPFLIATAGMTAALIRVG
jgi:hypothetical protein